MAIPKIENATAFSDKLGSVFQDFFIRRTAGY